MVKTLNYKVSKDGSIDPAEIQLGGVQGEHKVTVLNFELEDEWYEELRGNEPNDCKLIYHFEAYDSIGNVHYSDVSILTEKFVTYSIENFLTRHGGLVKVTLIISLANIEDGTCQGEKHSFTAQLRYIFSPYRNKEEGGEYASIPSLAMAVKENAKIASEAAAFAEEMKEGAEKLKGIFDENTTFVFGGGDAESGCIFPELKIDKEMSDYSKGLVPNCIIKEYVDNAKKTVKEETEEQMTEKIPEEIQKMYPVGSIWVGGKDDENKPIDPTKMFGGKWEIIDKEFETNRTWLNDNETERFIDTEGCSLRTTALGLFWKDHEINVSIIANTTNISRLEQIFYVRGEDALGKTRLSNWGIKPNKNPNDAEKTIFHPSYTTVGEVTGGYTWATRLVLESDHSIIVCRAMSDGQISGTLTVTATFKINLEQQFMLDEFCDKFYWKKTSEENVENG